MPPKKNKKPSKNGYYEFVLECQRKKNFNNMRDAEQYAAQKWALMKADEREPYSKLAQIARSRHATVGRLNCANEDIDEVERQRKQMEQQERNMKDEINILIGDAKKAGFLDEEVFLVIHVNHLVHSPTEDKWFVCEIAIASFTLRDGVNSDNVFHEIVYPGPVTTGYYSEAVLHSKQSHLMCELVQREDKNNEREVFQNMIKFMEKFAKDGKMPILFCDYNLIKMVTALLEMWAIMFDFNKRIKVYNLQYMFYALRNAVSKLPENPWRSESFAYAEIAKDPFDFTSGISCEYHDISDRPNNCSKSIVTRYVYDICNCCCGDLKIEVIKGHHVPLNSRLKSEEVIMPDEDERGAAGGSLYGSNLSKYKSFSSSYQSLDARSASSISTVKAFGPKSNWVEQRGRRNREPIENRPSTSAAPPPRPESSISEISDSMSCFTFEDNSSDNLDQNNFEKNFPKLGGGGRR